MLWLDSLHKKSFNYLIFSSDDSSKYGLNVVESEYLDKEIKKHHFESIAKVISGTDEIPLVLLTKAQIEITKLKPKISINFTDIDGANQIARYESNTIKFSVLNQLEVLNIEITEPDKSDISLIVHLSGSGQGDHIFNIKPGDTKKSAEKIINFLKTSEKPFIITDLAHANGADPILINSLINSEINWDQCYGYSGWNTCSNTIGSALSIGINRWIAEKKNIFNKTAFKKCLITRFLDDYAYQTEIRGLKKSEKEINDLMKEYVQKFSTMLGLDNISTECSLPWKRSFEIEIEFINVI
jgi:hypothetical protein